VPWADAADDHQTDNVRWLSEVDGAILLPESDIGRLGAQIEALRGDPARCSELSAAARRRGAVSRSGALAELIERVAVTSAAS
jgi:UDP-N-acetylglucosamine--N-acetylmuramyl-(pentapeptide) pyrophosphoryl-undecaprenol N-acetylglucosamine transferase